MKILRHGLKLKYQNTVSGRLKKAGYEMLNSWDDVVSDFDDWLILLNDLDGDYDALEKEVWEIARESEDIPHFGNIRQSLVAGCLENVIHDRWPFLEVEYHINAICSYFSINGEPATTLRDLDAAIGAYCRENEIVI